MMKSLLGRKNEILAIDGLRDERQCRICGRSCNDNDPVNRVKRLRWMRMNLHRICPETQLVRFQARIDHYCNKASFCRCSPTKK